MAMARLAALLWLAAVAAVSAPAEAAAAHIELRIVDDYGEPLDGVSVEVRGSGLEKTYDGGLSGRLGLSLPVGVYELRFSRPDFYELALLGIEIEPPEGPQALPAPFEPLRVMLTRRLILERDLPVIGPRYVDPPPLEISFRPQGTAVRGQPAHGVITLRNSGEQPVQLPLDRQFQWTPQTLLMRLVVAIDGSDAAFDEPFVCLPPKGCQELPPGGSIEVPVRLNSQRAYLQQESQPTAWNSSGDLAGTVGAYLVFPQGAAEVPTYTRSVEASFQITVQPGTTGLTESRNP